MATRPLDLINEITRVLTSIRAAFDAPYMSSATLDTHFNVIRSAYLKLEELRYTFRLRTRNSRHRDDPIDDAVQGLAFELIDFANFSEYMDIAYKLRYRMTPRTMPMYFLNPILAGEPISAGEAIRYLIESLERMPTQNILNFDDEKIEVLQNTEKLRRIVPKQQVISPVHFDIDDGKIVIVHQPGRAIAGDQPLAQSAKEDLVEKGARLLAQLTNSNCDPRLLESVEELQNQLVSGEDIVKLGISNIGCEFMCDAFLAELPDAVCAMLKTQTSGIGMYVAQFSEWQKFSENAASVQIDQSTTLQIHGVGLTLIKNLESNPELSSPEVPRIIKYLNNMINDPAKTAKQSAFAVLRTIENLIIKVYQYSADFFDQTITKTTSSLSTTMSKLIVAGLLGIAIPSALSLTPIASQIEGIAWVRHATEIVKQNLKNIDDI